MFDFETHNFTCEKISTHTFCCSLLESLESVHIFSTKRHKNLAPTARHAGTHPAELKKASQEMDPKSLVPGNQAI